MFGEGLMRELRSMDSGELEVGREVSVAMERVRRGLRHCWVYVRFGRRFWERGVQLEDL